MAIVEEFQRRDGIGISGGGYFNRAQLSIWRDRELRERRGTGGGVPSTPRAQRTSRPVRGCGGGGGTGGERRSAPMAPRAHLRSPRVVTSSNKRERARPHNVAVEKGPPPPVSASDSCTGTRQRRASNLELTPRIGHQACLEIASGWRCQHGEEADSGGAGTAARVHGRVQLEIVRQFEVRPAQGASQAQIARELDLSVPMLQSWVRSLARQPDRPVLDVFSAQGRLPSDREELRRLQRELHRLQQENSFLKAAAAYFAKESR